MVSKSKNRIMADHEGQLTNCLTLFDDCDVILNYQECGFL